MAKPALTLLLLLLIASAAAAQSIGRSALEPILAEAHLEMKEATPAFSFYEVTAVTHEIVVPQLIIEVEILEPSPFHDGFHGLSEEKQDRNMVEAARDLKKILVEELDEDIYWDDRITVQFMLAPQNGFLELFAKWDGDWLRRDCFWGR